MGFSFGDRSINNLATCHEDLQAVMHLAIKRTAVDFGIHDGGRTMAKQQEYFNQGASRINPQAYESKEALAKRAKHIIIEGHPLYGKSRAADIHVSRKFNGKSLAWDDVHLAYIAGVITSCAQELKAAGEINHIVKWGGDWDTDGIIALDQSLKDLPHFQLHKP